MNKIKNKYLVFTLGLGFLLVLIMRFVFGWCNIWICISGLGLIIAWQIATDFSGDGNIDD